jgi:branched-chain amino acid transport system ATP-binding protein
MVEILRTENLSIHFGGLKAVNRVSFSQREGEIVAIIGPNGSGKTTIFNLLTGIYKPLEGRIFFYGENITTLKSYQMVKRGISRTFQNIRLFPGMTVLENLLAAHPDCNGEGVISAFLGGKKLKDRRRKTVSECENFLRMMGLEEYSEMLATKLPYGKQRLLEIARALATGSRLVLLDEPGAGMNSTEKNGLVSVIGHITGELKRHVLLIEHDMKFVMDIADKIIVLDYGEKIAEGTPEEIRENPQVIEAYLGKGNFLPEGDGI